jgi:hypothetical protein
MSQLWSASLSRPIHMFWAKLETVRCAVPLLIPVASVISRHEWPYKRKWAIFEAVARQKGHYQFVPSNAASFQELPS